MKVIIIHNKYQLRGGEDSVVEQECNLLKQAEHQIYLFLRNNDEIRGIGQLLPGFNTVWSQESARMVGSSISRFLPDLAHVHNFFPLITPSVFDSCISSGIPVVQTLHNYRTICPGAMLMRDGQICEKCVFGTPFQAVIYKCYRDSYLGSLAVARMVDYHRRQDTWNRKIDRFIALTEFAKSKFVEAGFQPTKISVKPNFIADPCPEGLPTNERNGALFVGRLSEEKGIATMLRAWQWIDYPLTIAGNGPLASQLTNTPKQINWLGQVNSSHIDRLMTTSAFLVMPSEWYEGFPMVLIEAFAHGLPVVTSKLGSLMEIVEDGVTGLHFESGNAGDLAEKVQWLIDHPRQCREMGENARQVYLKKYTPERNYRMLMQIYQEAINARKGTNT